MENKEKCFADLGDNRCFCLKEKYCNKGKCNFYKTKKQAKEDYMKSFTNATNNAIDKTIHNYFVNLQEE